MLYVQFGGVCINGSGVRFLKADVFKVLGYQQSWDLKTGGLEMPEPCYESQPPCFWRVPFAGCLISKLHCAGVFAHLFCFFSVLQTAPTFWKPRKVVDFEERSASQLQYLQQSLESKAWFSDRLRRFGAHLWWFQVSGPWLFRVFVGYIGDEMLPSYVWDLCRDYKKPWETRWWFQILFFFHLETWGRFTFGLILFEGVETT